VDFQAVASMLFLMGGFMAVVVGVNHAIRWSNRKLSEGDRSGTLARLEHRVAELEERVDFTERALTQRSREALPPNERP